MTEIPVYNKSGQVDYILELKEDVEFVSGRTSKTKELYYKGVGSSYLGHSSISPNGYKKVSESSVFYYGWNVSNPEWEGKFGIFQDRFQPFFSDYIGGCGCKELSLISKSKQFELSAVDVIDCVEHDTEHKQYYFVLNYKSPRVSYSGNCTALINLLVYMVQSGWNFSWDKTSINDINDYGYVTDVADLFYSNDIKHAFGTVYSVLYSLYQLNRNGYDNLMSTLKCSHNGLADIPFVVMLFLKNSGKDLYIKQNIKSKDDLYIHLVGNVLLRGRNCAGVENEQLANDVMLQYLDRFKKQIGHEQARILEVY